MVDVGKEAVVWVQREEGGAGLGPTHHMDSLSEVPEQPEAYASSWPGKAIPLVVSH